MLKIRQARKLYLLQSLFERKLVIDGSYFPVVQSIHNYGEQDMSAAGEIWKLCLVNCYIDLLHHQAMSAQ